MRGFFTAPLSRVAVSRDRSDDATLAYKVEGLVSGANYSSRRAVFILFINGRLVDCGQGRAPGLGGGERVRTTESEFLTVYIFSLQLQIPLAAPRISPIILDSIFSDHPKSSSLNAPCSTALAIGALKRAVEAAYQSYLPKNAHPFLYLSVVIRPDRGASLYGGLLQSNGATCMHVAE